MMRIDTYLGFFVWLCVCASACSFVLPTSPTKPSSRLSPNQPALRRHATSSSSSTPSSRSPLNETFADLTPVAFGTIPDALEVDSLPTSPMSIQLPLIQLALAGSLTTIISDISMHPIDCIKTLQQSDMGFALTFTEAARQLWQNYGLMGFYHGFLTYGVADATGGAFKFSVWETWKQLSKDLPLAKSLSWLYVWIGAGLAFVASSIVIVPGELLKQQLQMSHYDSLPLAVAGIFEQSGLAGFFVGYEGVLYRDVPYTILELGLYDLFKSLIEAKRPVEHKPQAWEEILAAAITGGVTAFLTTPIDVVKTKMMVDSEYVGDSFLECLLASIDHHGWMSVFAGVEARMAWILPFTAIYLPTYDYLKRQLLKRHAEHLQSGTE